MTTSTGIEVLLVIASVVGGVLGLLGLVYMMAIILDNYCCCCPWFVPVGDHTQEFDHGPVARKAGLWGLRRDERAAVLAKIFVGTVRKTRSLYDCPIPDSLSLSVWLCVEDGNLEYPGMDGNDSHRSRSCHRSTPCCAHSATSHTVTLPRFFSGRIIVAVPNQGHQQRLWQHTQQQHNHKAKGQQGEAKEETEGG